MPFTIGNNNGFNGTQWVNWASPYTNGQSLYQGMSPTPWLQAQMGTSPSGLQYYGGADNLANIYVATVDTFSELQGLCTTSQGQQFLQDLGAAYTIIGGMAFIAGGAVSLAGNPEVGGLMMTFGETMGTIGGVLMGISIVCQAFFGD